MPAPALTQAAPYFEAWNAHDAPAVTAALADGGTYADPTTESPLAGPALAEHVRALVAAFPDLSFEVLSSVPAGGRRGRHHRGSVADARHQHRTVERAAADRPAGGRAGRGCADGHGRQDHLG